MSRVTPDEATNLLLTAPATAPLTEYTDVLVYTRQVCIVHNQVTQSAKKALSAGCTKVLFPSTWHECINYPMQSKNARLTR